MGTVRSVSRKRFEKDVLPHFDALWRTALWLTMRRSHAEDLVLKTITETYRSRSGAGDAISSKLRLFRFLTREYFDGNGRRPQLRGFLDENGKATANCHTGNRLCGVKSIDRTELSLMSDIPGLVVRGAVARLRPQSRLVMILLHLEGFSYEEIAYITYLRKDSVKSIAARLHRLIPQILIRHPKGFVAAAGSRSASGEHRLSSGSHPRCSKNGPCCRGSLILSTGAAVARWENEGGASDCRCRG